MTFPFTALELGARELGLVVAVLIGIGFGFVLERAGFGRSTKLAAQFYFRDMTVFKVMFTAIVTAMLGLVIASGLGLADLRGISESIASWTYLWPMLAGGLLLGAGFIISGYCPGTSLVAAVSGNIDGAFTVAGVVTGTFIYSELLQIPAFHAFHNSGDKGAWFLYDLVPVPPAVLAVAIALMAIAAFIGAEKVEKIFSGGAVPAPEMRLGRRFAFATVVAIAAFAAITLLVPAPVSSASEEAPAIAPAELARIIVSEPWKVRIADVRDPAEFAKSRIPGSESFAASALADLAEATASSGRVLVVVDQAEHRNVRPQGRAEHHEAERRNVRPPGVRELRGGFEAWRQYALTPAAPPAAGATKAAVDEYLFRVSLNQMLTGRKEAPAPIPAAGGGSVAKPKKKGGGCSA